VDGFAPEVGRATVRLLRICDQDVEFPAAQTCCGQPPFNAGYHDQARAMAAQTVRILDATDGPIVVPSGSCADMIVHHFAELLERSTDEAAASRVAARTRELTQFLVDDLGVTSVGAESDGRAIVFHPSCHGLRNLGIDAQPRKLLDAAGANRCQQDEADQCCGFGGLFSIEMPAISAAILETKLDALLATGADTVVGGDLSCLLHIEGGLARRGSSMQVRHIAEVLGGEE
jgi:L-lactate dehydrogenase complex protein LldE